MGTPSYMAPEQADGEADRPARGCVLAGRHAVRVLDRPAAVQGRDAAGNHAAGAADRAGATALLNPKVPRDLETICLKCLQKEPVNRYARAAALADDLRRFRSDEPIGGASSRPGRAGLEVGPAAAGGGGAAGGQRAGGRGVARHHQHCRRSGFTASSHDLIEQRDRANKEAEKVRIAGEEVHAEGARRAQRRGTSPGEGKGVRDQAEKAENRLLDGLLRPIGHNWNPQLDPAEKQALAEVVDLDARLRCASCNADWKRPQRQNASVAGSFP